MFENFTPAYMLQLQADDEAERITQRMKAFDTLISSTRKNFSSIGIRHPHDYVLRLDCLLNTRMLKSCFDQSAETHIKIYTLVTAWFRRWKNEPEVDDIDRLVELQKSIPRELLDYDDSNYYQELLNIVFTILSKVQYCDDKNRLDFDHAQSSFNIAYDYARGIMVGLKMRRDNGEEIEFANFLENLSNKLEEVQAKISASKNAGKPVVFYTFDTTIQQTYVLNFCKAPRPDKKEKAAHEAANHSYAFFPPNELLVGPRINTTKLDLLKNLLVFAKVFYLYENFGADIAESCPNDYKKLNDFMAGIKGIRSRNLSLYECVKLSLHSEKTDEYTTSALILMNRLTKKDIRETKERLFELDGIRINLEKKYKKIKLPNPEATQLQIKKITTRYAQAKQLNAYFKQLESDKIRFENHTSKRYLGNKKDISEKENKKADEINHLLKNLVSKARVIFEQQPFNPGQFKELLDKMPDKGLKNLRKNVDWWRKYTSGGKNLLYMICTFGYHAKKNYREHGQYFPRPKPASYCHVVALRRYIAGLAADELGAGAKHVAEVAKKANLEAADNMVNNIF